MTCNRALPSGGAWLQRTEEIKRLTRPSSSTNCVPLVVMLEAPRRHVARPSSSWVATCCQGSLGIRQGPLAAPSAPALDLYIGRRCVSNALRLHRLWWNQHREHSAPVAEEGNMVSVFASKRDSTLQLGVDCPSQHMTGKIWLQLWPPHTLRPHIWVYMQKMVVYLCLRLNTTSDRI